MAFTAPETDALGAPTVAAVDSPDRFWASRPVVRVPVRLVASVAGWTMVGCVFALPGLQGAQWRTALLSSLAQWWSWGLLAPAIVAVDRRLPLAGPQPFRRVPVHLVLSVCFTTVYLYVFAGMRAALNLAPWPDLYKADVLFFALRGMFFWSCLVYWLILGVWQAHHYSQRFLSSELRLARLERQAADARLNALRMQLDPHFLFNALNTISSQVERDPSLARDMIEHLGDLFRSSLESRERQQLPLSEELAYLEHYLAIQRIRFGNRLTIDTHIDADARLAAVPAFFIQPLVENAIRHGVSSRVTGGRVTISAHRRGTQLVVTVTDDGVGLPAGWSLDRSAGFGLSATRERISGLNPQGGAALTVQRAQEGGTEVRVSLPYRILEGNGNDDST